MTALIQLAMERASAARAAIAAADPAQNPAVAAGSVSTAASGHGSDRTSASTSGAADGSRAAVETALSFGCAGERLAAILSLPPAAAPAAGDTGVVIVVGGPQYRAGSHRQFVMLARHLAAAGWPCLRFDIRGMGDSSGALRNFEHSSDDIAAAIAALRQAAPGVQRVVLWGLCDAASAALLYLNQTADPQVAGLALLNPWVRSEASLARTHVRHYYRERLLQRSFWLKLLRGGVALQALRGLVSNLRAASGGTDSGSNSNRNTDRASAPDNPADAPYPQRMARGWLGFSGPVLLMLSGADLTAREFADAITSDSAWQAALRQHPPLRVDVAGADHTCSAPAAQRAVEQATSGWLAELAAAARPGGAAPHRVQP